MRRLRRPPVGHLIYFPKKDHTQMPEHFYDKVTRKFGTFNTVPHPIADYPEGNPEAIFEQKLLELSGKGG